MTAVVGVAMIAAAGFCIVTAVRVARSDIPKKKRWVFFSLIGIGSLSYSSVSGDFDLSPLSFQLLSAGFLGEFPGGPYLLKLSFPLGAFLAARHLKAAPFEAQSRGGSADIT